MNAFCLRNLPYLTVTKTAQLLLLLLKALKFGLSHFSLLFMRKLILQFMH